MTTTISSEYGNIVIWVSNGRNHYKPAIRYCPISGKPLGADCLKPCTDCPIKTIINRI